MRAFFLVLLLGCSAATSPIAGADSGQSKKLAGSASRVGSGGRTGQGVAMLDLSGGAAGRVGTAGTGLSGAAGQPAVDHDATVASADAEVDGGVGATADAQVDAQVADAQVDAGPQLQVACGPCKTTADCALGFACGYQRCGPLNPTGQMCVNICKSFTHSQTDPVRGAFCSYPNPGYPTCGTEPYVCSLPLQ